jgi:beta-galactosidase beta subunit
MLTKPYEDKNDSANYSGEGTLNKATPTTFFIFFPADAHRPGISPGGNKIVKKLVIKVRASA